MRGLGSISVSVPLGDVINVTKVSNSKGDSLTLNILCTRKSQHCLRTLSACAEEHVARTDHTAISRIHRVPTTLTLRRHPSIPKIHSAFNAVDRLLGDLHLLFSEVKSRIYRRYKTHGRPAVGITTRLPVRYAFYNKLVRPPSTRSLTFGTTNTYPAYSNAKVVERISHSTLMPSRSGDVSRKTILP